MADKSKILIVDDTEINRSLLADILGNQYDILEASDGAEAVSAIEEHHENLSLVLLDIVMPQMDGFEVLETMRRNRWIDDIPVIMITSETGAGSVDRAFNLGVTDFINRPFDENLVQRRVKNTIMLYSKKKLLEEMVAEQILEKEQVANEMVEILSNIVEFRNGESGRHVLNIRTITEMLLRKLVQLTDRYPLTKEDIHLIVNASSLHDIGKISIPEAILNKPGKLTDEEYELMKTHSAVGAQILEKVTNFSGRKLAKVARSICRWHHERFDGKGYPDGLTGDKIPIEAQVVSLADVYDALTHARVYKPAYSHAAAMKMILNGECGTFNPLLIRCLGALSPSLEEELRKGSSRDFAGTTDLRSKTYYEAGQASARTLTLLEQERLKYQFFASMSNEIQFEYSEQTDILSFSEWGASKLGLHELIVHPADNEDFNKVLSRKDYFDIHNKLRLTTPDNPVVNGIYCLNVGGQPRWHRIVARPLWGDGDVQITRTIGKFVDIHDEIEQLNAFKKRAEEDSLTKLQNHMTAREYIEAELAVSDKECALLVFDLDNFKAANDGHGHLFGDEVLKYVARKVIECIRPGDIAARIGGDEFLIFFSYTGNPKGIVQRIFKALSDQYEGCRISASMGVVCSPEYGRDYERLFRCADRALYAAKQNGKHRYFFYDETVKDDTSVLSPIENDLL